MKTGHTNDDMDKRTRDKLAELLAQGRGLPLDAHPLSQDDREALEPYLRLASDLEALPTPQPRPHRQQAAYQRLMQAVREREERTAARWKVLRRTSPLVSAAAAVVGALLVFGGATGVGALTGNDFANGILEGLNLRQAQQDTVPDDAQVPPRGQDGLNIADQGADNQTEGIDLAPDDAETGKTEAETNAGAVPSSGSANAEGAGDVADETVPDPGQRGLDVAEQGAGTQTEGINLAPDDAETGETEAEGSAGVAPSSGSANADSAGSPVPLPSDFPGAP